MTQYLVHAHRRCKKIEDHRWTTIHRRKFGIDHLVMLQKCRWCDDWRKVEWDGKKLAITDENKQVKLKEFE